MAWQLESIRATVFAPDIKAVGLLTWEGLTETSAVRAQTSPEIDGTVEAGPYRGQWLTMGVARRPGLGPGRADLILAPSNRTVDVLDVLGRERMVPAAIGPFTANFEGVVELANKDFLELANKWLSTVTYVRRLALACTIFERTDSQEEAVNIILGIIPSFKKTGDDRIIDLLIQLNRPRRSRVDSSIFINRLARWSARTVEVVVHPFSGPLRFERAQADLDISTAGEANIAGGQIPGYLEEFTRLLVEIAEKGDTPGDLP
jgi:hypothetical protein